MDKVRIGIVGIGNMGGSHSTALLRGDVPDAELTAVCDIVPERLDRVKDEKVAKFADAEEMYKSGLVDAVIVAVPHYQHAELVIKALENGLHALSEKPAGVYTKQVREMNEAAAKSDKVFGIMYNQRTTPVYQKLREMIQDGTLGKIKRINWQITNWYRPQSYHDSGSWRSTWKDEGGGALINQCPHNMDLWQWMFGMPETIHSFVDYGKYYDIEVEDDVTAFMKYADGSTGVFITSTGEAPGTNRLEVACDMGKVVVEDNYKMTFYRNTVSEREFNKTFKGVFGAPETWECKIPIREEKKPPHSIIMDNWVKSILTGSELLAPGEEGIKGLTISNSIHLSSWTGETIDVANLDEDKFLEILNDKIAKSTYVKKVVEQVAGGDISSSFGGH